MQFSQYRHSSIYVASVRRFSFTSPTNFGTRHSKWSTLREKWRISKFLFRSLYLCTFYFGKKPSATDIENCLYYSKTLRSDEIQLNLDSNPVPLVTIILFDNHATIVWHKKSYLEFFSPNIKIFLHFFIGPCICRWPRTFNVYVFCFGCVKIKIKWGT